MKKESKEKHFIKNPIYEGGLNALRLFIRNNLQYPESALAKKIEGTVFVKYTINYKGVVIGAKVLKGIGHGCDDEAIRLVKTLKFKTSKTRKIKIQYHKSIQIHFKLPKHQEAKTIQYSYSFSTTSNTKKDQSNSSTYNYTITLD